ncbi:permease [Dechloromonas sp. A34]|uniref:permease n=1 Tax=Dechloromonas sp. A34 TaxID=447588 RepID=UPI002248C5CE|nr:permease [Dechloromonas sp. A34]
MPPLAYYQLLSRLSPAELSRERLVLAALPQNPNTHLRTAMLFGHPRGPQDLGKATQQLELVLKSNDPAAVSLQPLARLLADNYAERQKAEGQLDRQGQQLKDSQRKTLELQEKLDGLADIERTLPTRPAQRPVGARSLK